MLLGVAKDLVCAVPVLSGSVVLLRTSTIRVVSCKSYGYRLPLVFQNEIDRPVRLGIALKQLAEQDIFACTLGSGNFQ